VSDEPDVRVHVDAATARLAEEFAGTASPETVQRVVDENVAYFSKARVQNFVPIFVERFTRQRLRALQSSGSRG
jgi:hypothetical protein